MPELVTIARPYAKAAFDFAVENHTVSEWQSMLTFSAEVSCNKSMAELFSGAIAPEKVTDTFIMVCGEQINHYGQNLIRVMAENGRLAVLPNVLKEFIHLRTSQELTSEVEIISVSPLNEKHLKKIIIAMEKHLSRKVKLNCKIDKSIMAGLIIRTGDMVIDGSVHSRFKRLANALQS
ncbi:MAG: ATP synthase F1 complex subunit delta [Sodalis sp. Fse]|nr:MAG: ATP synthase F1 complex subunit delta [Sodalis sp. Fle]UVK78034.1 MAG: ATP synthase F1 complex subunit delta [Sodalis sp. Fse]UVK79314.1 MAG: ATP synthase F1 complex subunit delta [Sodalis sp. Ffu]